MDNHPHTGIVEHLHTQFGTDRFGKPAFEVPCWMVRAIFAPGLTVDTVDHLIDRLLARLSRSRLKPFVRLRRTIHKHRDGINAARRLKLSTARAEAMNNRVKLIVGRAYGCHSGNAALALNSRHLRPSHTQAPTRTRVSTRFSWMQVLGGPGRQRRTDLPRNTDVRGHACV